MRKNEDHVRLELPAEVEDRGSRTRGEDQGGKKPGQAAEESLAQQVAQHHAAHGGEGYRKTCREFRDAEKLEGACGEPVKQGRLVEQPHKVDARNDPVVENQHLAGYFRVPAFIEVVQGGSTEFPEQEVKPCQAQNGNAQAFGPADSWNHSKFSQKS